MLVDGTVETGIRSEVLDPNGGPLDTLGTGSGYTEDTID